MIWPPPDRDLEGEAIRLEPIRPRHYEPLLAASDAAEAWEWIDRRVPGNPAAFRAWFEARLAASRAGEEWCYVTCRGGREDAVEPGVIGSSSYLAIRTEHDGLEIGWTWLHPSAWRTGANREAKLLMLAEAFETLGCMRVEFKTDARNERSREALLRLGARFEGIHRKHMLMPVVGVRDSAYFAITDEDWPPIRERLEADRRSRAAESAGRTA